MNLVHESQKRQLDPRRVQRIYARTQIANEHERALHALNVADDVERQIEHSQNRRILEIMAASIGREMLP